MTTDQETYLGDGLYASFDGYQVKLRAPRYLDSYGEEISHEVYLETHTLRAFIKYLVDNKLLSQTNDKS